MTFISADGPASTAKENTVKNQIKVQVSDDGHNVSFSRDHGKTFTVSATNLQTQREINAEVSRLKDKISERAAMQARFSTIMSFVAIGISLSSIFYGKPLSLPIFVLALVSPVPAALIVLKLAFQTRRIVADAIVVIFPQVGNS